MSDFYVSVYYSECNCRFHRRGSRRLNQIRTQSTSQTSLPMSRFTSHHQRQRVHRSSISRRLRKAMNCRTLSHFHIMAAAPVLAATSVICPPRILSLRCILSNQGGHFTGKPVHVRELTKYRVKSGECHWKIKTGAMSMFIRLFRLYLTI